MTALLVDLPPEIVRLACDHTRGAGVIGGAHMGGSWARPYILGSGQVVGEIHTLLEEVSREPLPPELGARVKREG